jgi:hypothetical protein
LSTTGERHIETGIGLGVRRRADSWYDGALVTRAGEDILSEFDSWAIEELRRLRLIWSGWGSDDRLRDDEIVVTDGNATHRRVVISDLNKMRLFFLSLLWRAAASTRPEFSDVVLADDDLEDLRLRLVNRAPGPEEDYPVQLFQVITLGTPHNRTPRMERKRTVRLDATLGPAVTYARFYFDGLVSHIHLARGQDLDPGYLTSCMGFGESTLVVGHTFAESRTLANLREMFVIVGEEMRVPNEPVTHVSAAIIELWPRRDIST